MPTPMPTPMHTFLAIATAVMLLAPVLVTHPRPTRSHPAHQVHPAPPGLVGPIGALPIGAHR